MSVELKALILKVGGPCNNRCRFCDEAAVAHETDAEKLKARIRAGRPECAQVVFTGSEPTLHPAIVELVSEAKGADYRVITVVSNGRMFAYGKFAREMILAGMTELMVPIHGAAAVEHDRVTGAPGSFEQAVAGIRNVRRISATMSPFNGVSVTVGTVVLKDNYQSLSRVAELAVSLGAASLFFIKEKSGSERIEAEHLGASIQRAAERGRQAGVAVFTKGFVAEELGGAAGLRYEDFAAANPVIAPAMERGA